MGLCQNAEASKVGHVSSENQWFWGTPIVGTPLMLWMVIQPCVNITRPHANQPSDSNEQN